MQKSHWAAIVAAAVLLILGFVVARALYFGVSATTPYVSPEREYTDVSLERARVSARKIAEDIPPEAAGVVLVDFAHDNALFKEELTTLFSKLVSRGLRYEIITAEQNGDEKGLALVERLKYAKALVLPLPRAEYTDQEIAAIGRFVENGGRLLIIGDPTRTVDVDALNNIAGNFGIIYADDYLYSLNEASIDNNYRNVIYTNFVRSPVTKGLSDGDKVIFYSGGSVNAPGHEIVLGDEYTVSSTSEGGRIMAAAALTTDDRVLALGDLTFFTEPYSAAESNGTLINNIADFLTTGKRTYQLQDFPHFFNPDIDVVFDNTLVFNSQFEDSVKLKEMLEQYDYNVNFANEIGSSNDVIFVGRFGEAEVVQEFLDAANIVILEPNDGVDIEEEAEVELTNLAVTETVTSAVEAPVSPRSTAIDAQGDEDIDQGFVEGRIQIEGVGELEQGGSTLFYRYLEGDRNILIILSDNPDTNADAFELLMDNELSECAVGPAVAVCQTETPDKKLPPSLRSTRIDKILVVADDDGRPRLDNKTSAVEYQTALSDTYKITLWTISRDGSPTLDEMQEYDAVVWTSGDYWDDSIGGDNAETLTEYIEAGGNLILSGASIAFDWDHTEFLENVVHADYLDFAEQEDIEVALDDHPISKGFAEGDVLTLTVNTPADADPLMPDVVNHTSDARVIFQRGPGSEQSGAASIIAFEDDRSKVAYFAFPVYQLLPEVRATLLKNVVDWFTRKPLDLPGEDEYTPFDLQDGPTPDNGDRPPVDEEPAPENGEDSGGDSGDGGENGNGEDTEGDDEGGS